MAPRLTAFDCHDRTSTQTAGAGRDRVAPWLAETLLCGPLFAIAKRRCNNTLPLEPEENWDFWTKRRTAAFWRLTRAYPPQFTIRRLLDDSLRQEYSRGIEAHYDVSNEFYRLFLDSEFMFYSAADFAAPGDSLEDAQRRKAQYLLHLIDPKPGQRILDFGCGWGGMLRYIANHTGDRDSLNGVTLSHAQCEFVRKLGFHVAVENFLTAPVKPAGYDLIYSIGALEHVRPADLAAFAQRAFASLRPGGKAVHQFFSLAKERLCASMLVAQLFFPGSLLSPHAAHLEAARSAGFEVLHDSVHDYRPTLHSWYRRLAANKARALGLVGPRVYNRYATFFPVAWTFFSQGEAELHRVVLWKP